MGGCTLWIQVGATNQWYGACLSHAQSQGAGTERVTRSTVGDVHHDSHHCFGITTAIYFPRLPECRGNGVCSGNSTCRRRHSGYHFPAKGNTTISD